MSLNDDLAADLPDIIEDIGVDAVFDVSGTPTTVRGIFNNSPTQNTALLGAEIDSFGPSFSFITGAVAPQHGQAVTIDSTGFTVNQIQVTGIELTTVFLLED